MSKQIIFQLLMRNGKEPNVVSKYPELVPETAEIIATQLSKTLCDSSKIKSLAAREKRSKILRFLFTLSNNQDDGHLQVDHDNVNCYLESLRPALLDHDLKRIVKKSNDELDSLRGRQFVDEVVGFYEKQNRIRKERCQTLELIKSHDNVTLSLPFTCRISNDSSCFDFCGDNNNESLIRNILGDCSIKTEDPVGDGSLLLDESFDYRDKQVRFAYGLLNLSADGINLDNLRGVLIALSGYERLEDFEVDFLEYLWTKGYLQTSLSFSGVLDCLSSEVIHLITEKCIFIIEKFVIAISIEIIKLQTEEEVVLYFHKLENRPDFIKFQKTIRLNNLKYKVKSIIYQLYHCSNCNNNLMTLCNLFN